MEDKGGHFAQLIPFKAQEIMEEIANQLDPDSEYNKIACMLAMKIDDGSEKACMFSRFRVSSGASLRLGLQMRVSSVLRRYPLNLLRLSESPADVDSGTRKETCASFHGDVLTMRRSHPTAQKIMSIFGSDVNRAMCSGKLQAHDRSTSKLWHLLSEVRQQIGLMCAAVGGSTAFWN